MTISKYEDDEKFLALFLVVLLASVGGVLISLIGGYKQ